MSDDPNHISILLDIKEDIGALNAQMMAVNRELVAASVQREELKEGQADARVAFAPILDDVTNLKKDVDDLKAFEGRVSAYIWAGGMLVSGVLFFLWKGLEFFASDIKTYFARLFH